MSYRYSTDPSLIDTYFSHLDLMMLSLLYNPLLSEKGNHTVTKDFGFEQRNVCLLYTSPSPRDRTRSRMPSSA